MSLFLLKCPSKLFNQVDTYELPPTLVVINFFPLYFIGKPTNLRVIPTESGGFIFKLTLEKQLPVPVGVELIFMEEGEEEDVSPSKLKEAFFNTTTVTTYRDTNDVPFNKFKVQVRVFHESINGPLRSNEAIYTKQEKSNTMMILVYTFGVAIGFCIVIIVIILAITQRKTKDLTGSEEGFKKFNKKVIPRRKIVEETSETATEDFDGYSAPTRCCGIKLFCDSNEEEVPESGITEDLAQLYVKSLGKVITFGLKDENIKDIMDRKHNELWPR